VLGLDPEKRGKQVRDVGVYTMIPMMMVVGPMLCWWLGRQIEKAWGGAPWPSLIGALFGLVAAVRQIYLILSRGGKRR
jgi:preprotein translocase subunit SecY